MELINLLVVVSFVALNLDVLLQNYRLYQIRESVDISLSGVALRLFAVIILAIKFNLLGEDALFVGQSILGVNVSIYLVLVTRYRYKKKRGYIQKKKKKRKSKKY